MKPRIDFYTAAGPLAFVVGFIWIYLTMVWLKIPGWPGMVGMAAYYAVGGLACHERHNNATRGIKGLLLGVVLSWVAVSVWTSWYRGDPVAMGIAMGVIAMAVVLATKLRLGEEPPFIAMPQGFLGATIFFGLFNTYMLAGAVPPVTLFGWLEPLVIQGPAQPHVAGVLAVVSAIAGILLGLVHQNISLLFSAPKQAIGKDRARSVEGK